MVGRSGESQVQLLHLPFPHDDGKAGCSAGKTSEGYISHTGERCVRGYIRFQGAEGESVLFIDTSPPDPAGCKV